MNIRLLFVITLLCLCFFLGFEKPSYSLNKVSQDNISELKILKYLPKNNKTFFISNSEISKITRNIKNNYETQDQNTAILIKNSTLAYLGIDLGTNKLEDIYDNELIITSSDNKYLDDILIIFKIKEKRDIDDLLNLPNKIDQPEKIIKIFRENKLNYLNFIYRTNDNYILTSTNKDLIVDALQSRNISKKFDNKYIMLKELLKSFKNQNNILLTKNFKINSLLNKENYTLSKGDYLLTLFNLNNNKIILKSYLLNNYKNIDAASYRKLNNENILDKDDYEILIFNNLNNDNKYLNHLKINSFEKAIFDEFNEKLNQNLLFIVSDTNWFIVFDNNKLSIESIKLLDDFNKDSLENNNNIYTIYSKNNLKIEKNIIKKSFYSKIFSVKCDNLTVISNDLISDADLELISKNFSNLKGESYGKYFLNKKMYFKNPYIIQSENDSLLGKINYFFKNEIAFSIIEFKEIIKESIPETIPIYYAETNLKIF